MRVVTPRQMRYIDDIAINKCGVSSITLMENAGSAVAEVARKVLETGKKKQICVVCGKGNNGGDGLVVSRHLINSDFIVDTYILTRRRGLGNDPRFNFELLENSGCAIGKILDISDLDRFINAFNYSLVVDAIFGTGFSGLHISEPARSLISFLNTTPCKIISVDIPSGLNALSGKVDDVAVQADVTVTLGLPKRGFFINDGPSYTGKLIVKNIGFPKTILKK